MPKNEADKDLKRQKEKLGRLLIKCRDGTSLRKIADQIGLSPSNLKYIEDGVNAPTADIYGRLVSVLKPDQKSREKMDDLYMAIRNAPPPDVCNIILQNKSIIMALRLLEGITLTTAQMKKIQKMILSIAEENALENSDII